MKKLCYCLEKPNRENKKKSLYESKVGNSTPYFLMKCSFWRIFMNVNILFAHPCEETKFRRLNRFFFISFFTFSFVLSSSQTRLRKLVSFAEITVSQYHMKTSVIMNLTFSHFHRKRVAWKLKCLWIKVAKKRFSERQKRKLLAPYDSFVLKAIGNKSIHTQHTFERKGHWSMMSDSSCFWWS